MFMCFFAGHTYEPRYSEKLPKGMTFKGRDPKEIALQMEAAKVKIYQGDVCKHCGSVVNRPSNFEATLDKMLGL